MAQSAIDVVRVPCAFGGHYYVRRDHLADKRRTLLPIYTRDGRLWTDTWAGERASRRGEATRLHRENIGQQIGA